MKAAGHELEVQENLPAPAAPSNIFPQSLSLTVPFEDAN